VGRRAGVARRRATHGGVRQWGARVKMSFAMMGGGGAQQQQQQTFSFPMLSAAEILATWDDVPLTSKELDKPTPGGVRAVYEALLEQCVGPSVRDEINNPLERATGHIEYVELHDESLGQVTFFRNLGRLLEAAGVHDLCLADVLRPEAKRFKRNLCAIINLQKFRLERLEAFDKLHSDFAALVEERAALDEERAGLEDKIRAIQDKREAEVPQVERLKDECRALEAELKQSNKEHASLQNDLKALKAKSNELKDYLATLRFQKLNLAQECERLEKNIVRSPERLKGELADQRRLLEQERADNAKLEAQQAELVRRDEALERAEAQSEQLLALIREAEEGMLAAKAAAKETKAMTQSVRDHDHVVKQLQAQKLEAERQLEIAQDRLARLEKTKALKLAAASHALNEGRRERDALKAANENTRSDTQARVNQIQALENSILCAKDAHAQDMTKRRDAFKRLDSIIDTSMQPLFERIST
jgi:kinetochore protein Nuf2